MAERVLIVDDTPANLGVLVETLSTAGYEIMVAEDGEEALAQVAHTLPDLILLDVMMPGIDGFETCRRLQAKPETKDIPVLFLTALSETTEKVKGFAAGARDYITKPLQHEEVLARVNAHLTIRRLQGRLAEQLAQRERFMRIAAHDLRNPLQIVLMGCEIAGQEANLTPMATKMVASAHRSATRMRNIIDTFLDVQRLHAVAGTGTLAAFDLAGLATEIVDQNRGFAERKQITLALELAPNLPPAHGEAGHAHQAVTNYVTNAIKYTPPGGRVTVRVGVMGAAVRVTVADSGPGVPMKERTELFKEFGRISNKPTGGEVSVGLGLSIVRLLVEAQKGKVGADFPATGGSEFWFELPGAEGGKR